MADQEQSSCSYRFISSSLSELPPTRDYDLVIRQQPDRAKMSVINERDRRPIEPPPILQMKWLHCSTEETKKCLQSPFYYLVANLVDASNNDELLLPAQDYLSGTTVSSLHRLRDIDNQDGGFYVFGDLSVKKNGIFKLQFSLFEIVEELVQNRRTLLSEPFTVYIPKHFPGPLEATFLSRTFSDQGVKMRIRKEHRLQATTTRKRKPERQSTSSQLNETEPTKGDTSKSMERASRRKVSPPSYAPQQSQDVHFGRFLSIERKPSQQQQQHDQQNLTHYKDAYKALPSQPLCSDYNDYHSRDPAVGQTIYPSPQSSTDYTPQHQQPYRSSPSLTHMSTPPSPTYAHYYSASPPTMTIDQYQPTPQQQPALPLASYHLSSSSSSSTSSSFSSSSSSMLSEQQKQQHIPSSPPSYSGQYHHPSAFQPVRPPTPMPHQDHAHSWGAKLPPLRAIMTDQPMQDSEQYHQNRFIMQLPPIQPSALSTTNTLPIYPGYDH
ncbi:hypothetical protein [Absidia glauca]|uniref:Velvet domain-containing protein n=1 Tax=Absidia glauca TaxID=4829 RepID=A0A168N1P1_ABSGL|nr:hypothetical protein [Absidia glauca]